MTNHTIYPPPLKKGDLICMLAPAGKINPEISEKAAENLRALGYRVLLMPTATGGHHYFSGTEEQRLNDFQIALDHPDCRAIVCARGGYGTIHLLNKLNWGGFERSPKWLVGFSDITLLHIALNKKGYASVHGGMAKEFAGATAESAETLRILSGDKPVLKWKGKSIKTGTARGRLTGGNLAVLCSLLGTPFAPEFDGAILFLEETGEYLYKIDRMLWQLRMNGVFEKVAGVLIGQFTDIADTSTAYGLTLTELLMSHFGNMPFPVATGLPAGHGSPNVSLVMGAEISLQANEVRCELNYV